MTVTSGFFNSQSGDRTYDAEDLSTFLEGIITDGILTDIGGELQVTAGSGMNALVASGKAWFLNTWTYNDGSITVTMDNAHPTLPRIDRVILEVDKTSGVRTNTIKKLTGTAASSPTPPTLINTSTKRQYSLARIAIAANASSLGTITDDRTSTDCGYARAMLAGSAEVQAQIDALVAEDVIINNNTLPPFTNKSGGTLDEGALVIFDKANNQAFTTTTLTPDRRVMGVVEDASIANNASGHIAMSGVHKVLVQGNVAVGQTLISSTTAGRAKANGGGWQPGMLGYAVTAYSGGGAGDVLAVLKPEFGLAAPSITVIDVQSGSANGSQISITVNLGSTVGEKLIILFAARDIGGAATPVVGGVTATVLLAPIANHMGVFKVTTTATGNVTITQNDNNNRYVLAVVLEGYDTGNAHGTAVRATGASTTPAVSTTDAVVGDLVISCLAAIAGTAPDLSSWGAGQTNIKAWAVATTWAIGATKEDAQSATESSSATLATSRTWGYASIPIHPL